MRSSTKGGNGSCIRRPILVPRRKLVVFAKPNANAKGEKANAKGEKEGGEGGMATQSAKRLGNGGSKNKRQKQREVGCLVYV